MNLSKVNRDTARVRELCRNKGVILDIMCLTELIPRCLVMNYVCQWLYFWTMGQTVIDLERAEDKFSTYKIRGKI